MYCVNFIVWVCQLCEWYVQVLVQILVLVCDCYVMFEMLVDFDCWFGDYVCEEIDGMYWIVLCYLDLIVLWIDCFVFVQEWLVVMNVVVQCVVGGVGRCLNSVL